MPVRSLFENLEDGASMEDFLEWFPGVEREQVEGVLEYASERGEKLDSGRGVGGA